MFKNLVKISLRNLNKSKTMSLINILGLAVGIGCALLLSLYVIDELSYERFHEKSDRIYRVVMDEYIGSPAPLAPALKQNLPEIEETVIIQNYTLRSKKLFSASDKRFNEERFILAEPSIFKIFSFAFLEGVPETALANPNSLVLTKAASQKYFGLDDPMGKTLTLENTYDFTVTGIIEDIPDNTHLKFDMMGAFPFDLDKTRPGQSVYQDWSRANYVTYVLLAEGIPFERRELEAKINRIKDESGEKQYRRDYFIQPLRDIHLGSNLRAEFEPNSSRKSVVFHAVIGIIILFIACINSMNLSTARSFRRAKEVGIRKVVGANRSQLIKQFFGESFVVALASFVIAVVLVVSILPAFNSVTGKHLSLFDSPLIILAILLLITAFAGTGSGIYPALFLSGFQPVTAFRSMLLPKSQGRRMRQILVLVQFSLSIIFIFCTLVVWKQLNFVKQKNLGMTKEHVINIPLPKEVQEKYEVIKNDIKKNPGVINAAASNFPPLAPYNHGLYWDGITEEDDKSMFWFAVDHDFLDTMEIELIEGRGFSREFATDTLTAYILNEAAVQEFGKEFLKGRKFSVFGSSRKAPVIGVVKDFHFTSLHSDIAPVILLISPGTFNHISVRTSEANIPGVLSHLRKVWMDHNPDRPFEYFFMDDRFDMMYKSEERLGRLFSYFAGLAIFISCLGLFALASFMAEQRTKEIGVRKVLGASVPNITMNLSLEFLKWILYANLIAWPVAFFVMHRWLSNFAYKAAIGIEVFLFSGLLALGIAFITVSYQSFKVAVVNIADTLRYE